MAAAKRIWSANAGGEYFLEDTMGKKTMWVVVCVALVAALAISAQAAQGEGSGPGSAQKADSAADGNTIRALVIGGMTMTGLWQEIAARFEKESADQRI